MSSLKLPVSVLTGVGLQTVSRLHKLQLYTLQDLLFHLPLRYEDRTNVRTISSLIVGTSALVRGRIEQVAIMP